MSRFLRRALRRVWRVVRVLLLAFVALGPGIPPPPPVPRRQAEAQEVGGELDESD